MRMQFNVPVSRNHLLIMLQTGILAEVPLIIIITAPAVSFQMVMLQDLTHHKIILGLKFSTVAYANIPQSLSALMNNFSHVHTDSVITDQS